MSLPTHKNNDKKSSVIWITGASRGIGRALSLELAQAGHTIIASARNQKQLTELCLCAKNLTGQIRDFPLDVTDPQSVNKAIHSIIRQYGAIDTAILNAGISIMMHGTHFNTGIVQKHFDLNVMGVSHCLAPLIAHMKEKRSGLIAINASVAGYRGLPNAGAYCATKAALISLAETLYIDLQSVGISVKVINPGFVKTPLTDKNTFPMPFLMSAEKAAKIIAKGLQKKRFEIRFPYFFSTCLKLLRLLPYRIYFMLIKKIA
ncbi:3-oxoacyl-[acyl-carrier-protein] reductase FabG [invertebrate metagenome]|uniref:3-oxoacyl-[acyl-carrier-protein] reductase FabG n=1 Tax=invertebrate metagenome TaxID=1711999 RepID=A0A2H9T5E6_9ZZZZ